MTGVDRSLLLFFSKMKLVIFSFTLACFVILPGARPSAAQASARSLPKCTGANGLSRAEIVDILNAHNEVRAALKLEPLRWDCKLADLAQQWAKRGVFEHRTDTTFGESIFVSGIEQVPVGAAVRKWMSEKPAWDNKAAMCRPGKICTHYTQIVWKKTTKIGCGINRDPPGKWKVLLVCNYDPAGNESGAAY